ncbi:MAG: hypothetical protein JST82_16825 [Bacteroidetes bacterium]|nr:hypothetical protein [Bacteroidota bacterium]
MRKCILLILMFACIVPDAQEFAVTNRKQHIWYVGIHNEIQIAVNKYECKDVKVMLSYGNLQATNDPCNYTVIVDRPGKVKLGLYAKSDNKLIGEQEYRVKYLPNPVADRDMNPAIKISAKELSLNIETNRKHFMEIDDSSNFKIEYFTITIDRCGQILFTKEIKGAVGDEEVKNWYSRLQPGDRVFFEEIEAYAPDGKLRRLGSMPFVITY